MDFFVHSNILEIRARGQDSLKIQRNSKIAIAIYLCNTYLNNENIYIVICQGATYLMSRSHGIVVSSLAFYSDDCRFESWSRHNFFNFFFQNETKGEEICVPQSQRARKMSSYFLPTLASALKRCFK